jgi:1-acyl-sn-glycerol-3-phosphate acyltransferase
MFLPISLVFLLVLLALFTLGALVLGLVAPFTSRRRPLRLVLFGLSYCVMEIVVIGVAGLLWVKRLALRPFGGVSETRWIRSHRAVLTGALGWVLLAARRSLNFQVILAETSSVATFAEEGPVLVLARHGGLGDSFALAHLLLSRFDRGVRIVLKDVLQFDPALDIVLNRLGCCFVPASGEDGVKERLAALAVDLRSDDALLLFPEGGNWTPRRRLRAIRHLGSIDQPEASRAARLMSNVLPPRPGGVLACLEARSDLRTVIVAHAGLDRIVSVPQVWEQLPLTVPMTIRIWPALPAPPSHDEQLVWLTTEWAVVNEWIDGHHSAGLDQPHPRPVALPSADRPLATDDQEVGPDRTPA